MANEQQQTEQRTQSGVPSQTKTSQVTPMQPRTSPMASVRTPTSLFAGPFAMSRMFTEQMDRMFQDFMGSDFFRFASAPWLGFPMMEPMSWPAIEIAQHGNRLEVRADVPGLRKEDVRVEVRDDRLRISGERRNEMDREEGGTYRSERSYGSFCRTVQLPEGANVDSTTATFENGVLTVQMDVPGMEQHPARHVEVRDASEQETRH
jgi:HSP20 family protein